MIWYDSRDWKKPAPPRKAARTPVPLPDEFVEFLREQISGDVILPDDEGYDEQRRNSNNLFDNYPTVIVMCETTEDIACCIKVAAESKFPTVVRSGGHSTGGFSTPDDTIVINIRRKDKVDIATDGSHVWVDAGCNFGTLNAALEMRNLHMPGGACRDVCIGGYMQGGGYGFTSRIFGMNCDQVVAFDIMCADGEIRRCDADNEPDLFWAVRGGTGSNFGVLLRVCFKLQPSAQFAGFSVRWDLGAPFGAEYAANALAFLQSEFSHEEVNDDLGFQMIWVYEGPEGQLRKPYLLMRGMYKGGREKMLDLLEPVLKLPGAVLEYEFSPLPYTMLNTILLTVPYEVPQFPRDMETVPPESKLSRILSRALDTSQWRTLIDHFLKSPNDYTTIAMEMYGARINKMDKDDNAFQHRDDYCDLFCDVFWTTEDERTKMEAYIQEWEKAVDPFWDGSVYQNYPRPGDHRFSGEFWTPEAYRRLCDIKRETDPNNVFRFPQGVGILTSES